jgi:hypothetical protein
MQQNITSKTGSAPIKKVGHTATTLFGSNPDAKGPTNSKTPRDLSAK